MESAAVSQQSGTGTVDSHVVAGEHVNPEPRSPHTTQSECDCASTTPIPGSNSTTEPNPNSTSNSTFNSTTTPDGTALPEATSSTTVSVSNDKQLLRLYDAHSHAGIDIEDPSLHESLHAIQSPSAVMSTEEYNWPRTLKATEYLPQGSVPALGIHPWFAHRVGEGWLERLRVALLKHPRALVGEIGLDKVARTPETKRCEYATQKLVFQQQLQLATQLQRPVSVHCVRAVGTMYDFLAASSTAPPPKRKIKSKSTSLQSSSGGGSGSGDHNARGRGDGECASTSPGLPPAVAMHSFMASPDWVPRFLALPTTVYFGFSEVVNHRNSNPWDKTAKLLRAVRSSLRLCLRAASRPP